jgi:hypothetical protein
MRHTPSPCLASSITSSSRYFGLILDRSRPCLQGRLVIGALRHEGGRFDRYSTNKPTVMIFPHNERTQIEKRNESPRTGRRRSWLSLTGSLCRIQLLRREILKTTRAIESRRKNRWRRLAFVAYHSHLDQLRVDCRHHLLHSFFVRLLP